MILSQIVLPWSAARDPYQWHRALWSLFPQRPDSQREFLYRIESSSPGQSAKVLMLSSWQPQASSVVPILAMRDFNPVFDAGQLLRFCLVANPVRCIKDAGGRLGKDGKPKPCRVPIIQEGAQLDWLARKLESSATLNTATVTAQAPLYFRKKGNAPGKLLPVRYDGILALKSADQFMSLLRTGVGPAKSFGCGLLSVART